MNKLQKVVLESKKQISNAYQELYWSLIEAPEGSMATSEFKKSMGEYVTRMRNEALNKIEKILDGDDI